ncbi:MAG: RNA polymerase sigma factor [Planctomycetes bacterium]|nr:RNA polymerase sigma factor [Planctomycetota bacterium]
MTDDAELLARAARGDRAAFGEFVVRHEPALLRFARATAHDETEADDVFQRTFLAAWRGAKNARATPSARPWLFAIARRESARLGRRAADRAARERSIDELGEDAGFGDVEHTPERMAHLREERVLVDKALNALSPEHREVLVLRDVEGLSGDEAAELLGLTLIALKARLHRARLALACELRICLREELRHEG